MEKGTKPLTNVLIKHKEKQELLQFANILETIAQKLKQEGQFTFMQGEKEVVVKPSQSVKVEYEYTTKGDKHSFEIEFDWFEGDQGDKSMKIC